MTNHLRLSKPGFLKKIRIYNDVLKNEEAHLVASHAGGPDNRLKIKPSVLEIAVDTYTCHPESSFSLKGGRFYFVSSSPLSRESLSFRNKKIYQAATVQRKHAIAPFLSSLSALVSARGHKNIFLLVFVPRLLFLKFALLRR